MSGVLWIIRNGCLLHMLTFRASSNTCLNKFSLYIYLDELVIFSFHYFLLFPLSGTIVAAVAPAVVLPCLVRLRSKGYGVAKGIPTLIIAVASIGDSTSVAIFGVIKSIMFSHISVTSVLIQGPISIIGGNCK